MNFDCQTHFFFYGLAVLENYLESKTENFLACVTIFKLGKHSVYAGLKFLDMCILPHLFRDNEYNI